MGAAGRVGLVFAQSEEVSPVARAPLALRFVCGRTLDAAEGRRLLDRAQEAYQSVGALHAGFLQESTIAALDETEAASGTVTFKKPGRMRWDYHFPERQLFLVQDQTVWFYQPDLAQVSVYTLEEVLLKDMPVSFLMGIGNLSKDFELRSSCATGAGVLFALNPRRQNDEADGLQSFELLIGNDDSLPRGARVRDVGGNVTTIFLSGLKSEDVVIAADTFDPTFPPGVDIDDRRTKTGATPK
jgi:outer membrane lipoprotein carrier protein